MSFRLLPEAEADVEAIVLYIADDSPSSARRWSAEIRLRFKRLGEMPGIGVARPDIRTDLRTLPFGSYMILYRDIGEGVEIIRVIHGARLWQDLL